MNGILHHLRGALVAVVALALSASLAFGAEAPGGYAAAGSYAGMSDPVAASGDVENAEDEDDEESEEDAEGGDNCLTDPRTLTAEELAAMSHGSIVCWAAHQETPEGYANHGAWVREWAHFGKGDDAADAAKTHGKGKGLENRP